MERPENILLFAEILSDVLLYSIIWPLFFSFSEKVGERWCVWKLNLCCTSCFQIGSCASSMDLRVFREKKFPQFSHFHVWLKLTLHQSETRDVRDDCGDYMEKMTRCVDIDCELIHNKLFFESSNNKVVARRCRHTQHSYVCGKVGKCCQFTFHLTSLSDHEALWKRKSKSTQIVIFNFIDWILNGIIRLNPQQHIRSHNYLLQCREGWRKRLKTFRTFELSYKVQSAGVLELLRDCDKFQRFFSLLRSKVKFARLRVYRPPSKGFIAHEKS